MVMITKVIPVQPSVNASSTATVLGEPEGFSALMASIAPVHAPDIGSQALAPLASAPDPEPSSADPAEAATVQAQPAVATMTKPGAQLPAMATGSLTSAPTLAANAGQGGGRAVATRPDLLCAASTEAADPPRLLESPTPVAATPGGSPPVTAAIAPDASDAPLDAGDRSGASGLRAGQPTDVPGNAVRLAQSTAPGQAEAPVAPHPVKDRSSDSELAEGRAVTGIEPADPAELHQAGDASQSLRADTLSIVLPTPAPTAVASPPQPASATPAVPMIALNRLAMTPSERSPRANAPVELPGVEKPEKRERLPGPAGAIADLTIVAAQPETRSPDSIGATILSGARPETMLPASRSTETSGLLTPMLSPAVGDTIEQAARDVASVGGERPLRFNVRPESLGPVAVTLARDDSGLQLRIGVETQSALQAVRTAEPLLTDAAARTGQPFVHVSVDLDSPGQRRAPRPSLSGRASAMRVDFHPEASAAQPAGRYA